MTTDQNTRPTPSADELKDLIHEALQDSMDVDWSTSVGAEHVVRALTEAGFLTRPTPSSDVAMMLDHLGVVTDTNDSHGLHTSADILRDVARAISRLSAPAQVEVTDEMARLREARKIISSTHKNAVVHKNCEVSNCPICDGGLFICADCGAAEIETEQRICPGPSALTATDAKPVVPAEPVAGERLRKAAERAQKAMAEYYRYFTGGETRGSYDGKPERRELWAAKDELYSALASEGKTDA